MDAVAFQFLGMNIYWYGILIGIGLALGVVLACFVGKYRGFPKDMPLELVLWIFPPAIIGARLYYCIFNGGPWGWEIFAIWSGGLAVYGSIIGGALGVLLFCVIRKKKFLDVADVVVPSLALGQAIGRWGCYFSKCCYGVEITNPAFQCFPFALQIEYPGNVFKWHLATMIIESLCNFLICVGLYFLLRKVNWKGVVLAGYMISYGVARCVIEGFRGDSLMIGSTIRVSQLLSACVVLGGIALLVWLIIQNKKQRQVE